MMVAYDELWAVLVFHMPIDFSNVDISEEFDSSVPWFLLAWIEDFFTDFTESHKLAKIGSEYLASVAVYGEN